MISSVVLWAAVLFNLLLSLALVRKVNSLPQMRVPETLEIGADAPEFAVETLSGDIVTRDNLNGNEIALVFISPGCKGCAGFMPKLQNLHPKAQQAGVELMVICLADAEQTGTYARELEFTAPIYTAPDDGNSLIMEFKVPGTPSYYLINRHGKIKAGGFFDQAWDQLTETWSSSSV